MRTWLVAPRSCAGWGRRCVGTLAETPVVDADHVLRPVAGIEAGALLEAYQPVAGIRLVGHEERILRLDDGQPAVHLFDDLIVYRHAFHWLPNASVVARECELTTARIRPLLKPLP